MMVVLPPRPPEQHDDDNEEQPPPKVVDETKHAIKDWVLGAAGVARNDDKNNNKNDHALPAAAESAAAEDSPRRDERRAHPQRRSNNNTTNSLKKDDSTKRNKDDVASTYQHDSTSMEDAIMPGEHRTRTGQGKDDVPSTAVDGRGDSSIQTPHSSLDATTQSSNDIADNSGKGDHGNGHHNDGVEHTHEEADDDTNNFQSGDDATLSTNFPQYLMDVIELESRREKPCILEWAEGGEAFRIRDKIQFERIVLPKHFSKNVNYKCKFASFVRKLYRWGFRRVEKAPSSSITFSHPLFIRGNKHRCILMRSIVKRRNPVGIQRQQQSSSNPAVVPPPSHRVGGAACADVDHGVVIPAAAADPRFHLARRTATNNNNTLQDHHEFSLNAALGHQEQQHAYFKMMARQQGIVLASSTGGGRLPAFSPGDLRTLMNPPAIGTSSSSTYWTIPTSQQLTSTTTSSNPHRRYLPATLASVSAPTMSELFEPRHQHHHNLETTTRTLSQQQSVAGGINVGSTNRIDSLPANATTMSPFNLSLPPGWPPPPPAGAAAMGYQFGVHLENNTTAVGTRPSTIINTTVRNSVNVVTPAVILASQIMKNNPGMEPWRALEFAKRMCGVVPESDTAYTGSSLP